MSSPHYANVIVQLASEIDVLTQSFVFRGYQALSQALSKPLASMCVLYIVLLGFGILRGLIKAPMEDFMKAVIRIGLIYLFAMNWSFFSNFAADLFTKGSSELGAVMMRLLPAKLPPGTGGVNGGLQAVFTEVVRVGNWVWNTGTFRHPGPFISALIVYLSGVIVIGFAFFELVAAKLMLSVCLCTAPLFVSLTLFDKTRSFFDQWLGKIVGFSLVLFFVSIIVGFCLHLLHWAIGGHYVNHAAQFKSVDWMPLMLCAILAFMAIWEVVRIAKSIGGSCCTSSGSAMVGGFMGGMMGSSTFGGLRNSLKQNILRTGQSFHSGGLAHKTLSKSGHHLKAIQQRMRGRK